MKIKAYKTEDEIPEGAVYMSTQEETAYLDQNDNPMLKVVHYFLVNEHNHVHNFNVVIENSLVRRIIKCDTCDLCKVTYLV